jgi:hypothetical protein
LEGEEFVEEVSGRFFVVVVIVLLNILHAAKQKSSEIILKKNPLKTRLNISG